MAPDQDIPRIVAENTDADGCLFYFAYGSNMNCKILSGRRKVFPLASYPCKTEDWVLTFHIATAMKYIEPGMGTIERRGTCPVTPADAQPAHGVLHYITQKDYLEIVKSEGGGGADGVGYYTEAVRVEVILDHADETSNGAADPTKRAIRSVEPVITHTFPPPCMTPGTAQSAAEASSRELKAEGSTGAGAGAVAAGGVPGRRRFVVPNALTLVYHEKDLRHEVTCSQRYWGLLVEGAREHKLPGYYISYLSMLPYYNPPLSLRLSLARFIVRLLVFPLFMLTIASSHLLGYNSVVTKLLWRFYLRVMAPGMELLYKYGLRPWAGNGNL